MKVIKPSPEPHDPVNDLIGLFDLIDFELGISTRRPRLSSRLSEVVEQIHRSDGVVDQAGVSVLLDAIKRLECIERLLSDNGSEPDSETSNG